MEIGHLLKDIRDAKHAVRSYSKARVFNPPNLLKEYQTHYANTLQISLNTLDSIEEEYQEPIPVDYAEPQPTCVCPDLGEENLFKITQSAIDTLKAESHLMGLMEENSKKKKASHEGGHSDRYDTLSGRSKLTGSGKKIKSDEWVDRSTQKGKNDPVSIMHPGADSNADPKKAEDLPKEPEQSVKSERKSLRERVDDRGDAGSRKSSVSPAAVAKDKDKKKRDKKEKRDKKDKKDKDKKRKHRSSQKEVGDKDKGKDATPQ